MKKRKKQGYEASGFNQYLMREEIAEEREKTATPIEERARRDDIEISAFFDKEIASIREEIYKIVDSNKLPVNKKKELLDNKVAQLDELFQEKKAHGWVHTNREFGRLVSDIEKLKDGLIEEILPEHTNAPRSSQNKPSLFRNTNKHREHYKLEKLFREKNVETYAKIGIAIGMIARLSKYGVDKRGRNRVKEHVLIIKTTFNKKSQIHWKQKLKATRRKEFDGLKLVSI